MPLFDDPVQWSSNASLQRMLSTLSDPEGVYWETDFLPLLVLTRQGRSTGKKPVQYWYW